MVHRWRFRVCGSTIGGARQPDFGAGVGGVKVDENSSAASFFVYRVREPVDSNWPTLFLSVLRDIGFPVPLSFEDVV